MSEKPEDAPKTLFGVRIGPLWGLANPDKGTPAYELLKILQKEGEVTLPGGTVFRLEGTITITREGTF